MQTRPLRLIFFTIVTTLIVVALTACGTADSESTTTGAAGDDPHSEFAYGEPAEPADAERTIEVTATSALRWEPATIGVKSGETVTFRITNESDVDHDFTLGDEAAQEEHEAEMAEMGDDEMMMDEPNAVAVPPGETRELTWTFAGPGTVLIGCHEPGHYDAGMVAEVLVVE